MAAIDTLLQIFAQSICAKTNALSCLDLKANQRNRLRKSITEDIRTCGGLLFPEVIKPEVSKAARQEAEPKGINLHEHNWHTQTKFDAGRKTFQWEHVTPVSFIQEKCARAKSEEDVLAILKNHLRIAWILKSEDAELTRLGFRSKRADPDSAYREAKIELLKSQDRQGGDS